MKELNNYEKEKLTTSVFWANMYSIIIIIPILLIYGIPYFLINSEQFSQQYIKQAMQNNNGVQFVGSNLFFTILIILIGVVLHELLHGITWAMFNDKGFKSIKFGIIWKMLTPYCHSEEPLKIKYYLAGTLMPAIILGFVPAVIAIFIGSIALLSIGVFFTIVASGDFLIVKMLIKEDMDDIVEDHPSEVGCYIYRRKKE